MVISFEHNFLFCHIGKTAGSSIANALAPFSHPMKKDRISKIRSRLALPQKPENVYFPVHSSCAYAAKRLPDELYEGLFKFAIVRNPWDRIVSLYHYILMNEKHHRHAKVSAMRDFDAFVRYEAKRGKFFLHQSLCGADGELVVDFVGKFENLSSDFDRICKKLDISASIPHKNKSVHKPYQEYYSKEAEDIVSQVWKRDIELFDYRFEAS